jgi:hypothetical protein
MRVSFGCLLHPKLPSLETFATDGKNLAMAYMGAFMGAFDPDAMMDDSPDASSEETATDDDAPTIFAALDAYLDKSGAIFSGTVQQWYQPAVGITANSETLRRLRRAEGISAIPNEEVREGCILDLEAHATMLQEAQSHGAKFVFFAL